EGARAPHGTRLQGIEGTRRDLADLLRNVVHATSDGGALGIDALKATVSFGCLMILGRKRELQLFSCPMSEIGAIAGDAGGLVHDQPPPHGATIAGRRRMVA